RAAGLPAAAAPYLQVNGQYRRLDGDWNGEARSLSLLLSRPGGALDPDTGRRVLPLELELRLG
ncbi:MAG: hypothetical protein JNJ60_13115, partial [Rhodocyclaceae bacterium]|nr:hypothetical protein [Rhodocyclaceae bacterium]